MSTEAKRDGRTNARATDEKLLSDARLLATRSIEYAAKIGRLARGVTVECVLPAYLEALKRTAAGFPHRVERLVPYDLDGFLEPENLIVVRAPMPEPESDESRQRTWALRRVSLCRAGTFW